MCWLGPRVGDIIEDKVSIDKNRKICAVPVPSVKSISKSDCSSTYSLFGDRFRVSCSIHSFPFLVLVLSSLTH